MVHLQLRKELDNMTIQEILEAHKVKKYNPFTCRCGWTLGEQTGAGLSAYHRAHVAEVLDKHMQEREAAAWEIGAVKAWQRSTPEINGVHYEWRSSGEPTNPYRKEPSDDS